MSTETAATAVETGALAPDSTATTDSAPVTTTKPDANAEPEWFTKRIGEITGRYRSEERRAAAAEAELARIRAEQAHQKQQSESAKPKTLADFEFDEGKYHAYVLDEARKAAAEAARTARTEHEREERAKSRAEKFKERETEYEKEAADYRQVAYGDFPLSEELLEVVMEQDSGPALIHYLGKNKDIARALDRMPPQMAAVELGRIDARLTTERKAKAEALEKAKAEKAVTQAPPPTPKLEGVNAQVEKDPSQMTDNEFRKWREKQIAQRR